MLQHAMITSKSFCFLDCGFVANLFADFMTCSSLSRQTFSNVCCGCFRRRCRTEYLVTAVLCPEGGAMRARPGARDGIETLEGRRTGWFSG
jgi:hypothetical protein